MTTAETEARSFRMHVNLGPQHPSTHGVLHLELEMYGEYVLSINPVLGYGHRMHEKMAEARPWQSFFANTPRIDYACSLPHSLCYASLLEQALGIDVPARARHLRIITSELNRITSHLLWVGAFLLDLGAFTPILYCFDDREHAVDILEHITGNRLTHAYMCVGGVTADADKEILQKVREFIQRMRGRFQLYDRLIANNIIFVNRTKDIGIITHDMARAYGASGPVLRGSGVPCDIRKTAPYAGYDAFEFDVPVGTNGDCLDRYNVRMQEMRQSLNIIEQALDLLPDGPVRTKVPRQIKPAPGHYSFSVEGARGDVTYWAVSDGSDIPYRLKIRSACMANLSLLPKLCEGMYLADLIATLGSLDLVIPEIDR
jgi:NADH-quinone oxidoreductase subunit D